MKKKEARILAAALLTGSTLLAAGNAGAAPADSDRSSATREIQRVGSDVRQEAEKNAKPMDVRNMNVRVSAVIVTGVDRMSEKTVRALLPELSRDTVNIRKLSQEIQSVNDTGALVLSTEFTPAGAGAYRVTVNVQEKKSDHVRLSVSNTGTDETGDWRTSLTYLNTNISGSADTFGAAFVTSPGHFGDVKVGALSYRKLMPQWKGAVSASVSHGRTNIDHYPTGTSLYDLNIGGKSTSADLHYQRFLSYTSRNKDILDFGIGYRRTESDYNFKFGRRVKFENDYRVLLATATYLHTERKANSTFAYNVGLATNINGDAAAYERIAPGSDRQFTLLRAGVNYQARTAGDWIGALRLNGQYTKDHIVPSEQIGAGGQMSVRGFDERAIGADKGFVGSLEIYTPEIMKHTRLLAFTDYAHLSNNKSSANRNLIFDSESIASAGLGVRYADGHFSLALDYARILRDADKVNLNKQNSRHWNLMASVNF
ncbi:ShlB/FhaC/HecB family hemolysin secretion/activation protein [Selenomonas massiliensis]|uniref:ShlB/FhaC/HecB family hemolysin secretion/activation protein n=1 Tax=Selenomonas massiliensis TaxID=2058293 RepID=UPI000D0E4D1C|nr:ShlB/FhaC/HecB family hemolysin secretion/activation protein [Selenomonas massiliensis]